ncbi:MAG: response regulator [Candidatus Paceibacterota bacterium]|jgi:CheY-like chemotaxis protein
MDKKYSILIVDDDKFLLDMYTLKFTEKGFAVDRAMNGPEALQKVDGGLTPDIFLVDIVMPEMDGFELIQHLVQRQKERRSTIIVLSNLGQKEDVEKGLSLGADGYIVKASATPSEVVEKVVEIVSHRPASSGQTSSEPEVWPAKK